MLLIWKVQKKMNLDDYKRLLEALQKLIANRRGYIERKNLFEQEFDPILNPKITSEYLHDLMDLNEYKRTEKKLIEQIERLEKGCKK